MPKSKRKLTKMQVAFACHYSKTGNAKEAAIAAGYHNPAVAAWRLMHNFRVHKAIMRRIYRRKKMLNDRYAFILLHEPKANKTAKLYATFYFLNQLDKSCGVGTNC